ncbi:MAG: HAD-IA family hydrolase, partial [Clostridia bacterium]
HFDIHEPNLYKLKHFIGPPLKQTIEETYGLSSEQGDEALRMYRERFSVKGIYENKLYPGMVDLLSSLKNAGATLSIASSKPHYYIEKILIHFGIDEFFDVVSGSEMDGRRTDKAEVIQHALASLDSEPSPRVVMVGDRIHDADGARRVGIDFVAAGYGYSEEDEFCEAPHVALVNSVPELKSFLLDDELPTVIQ